MKFCLVCFSICVVILLSTHAPVSAQDKESRDILVGLVTEVERGLVIMEKCVVNSPDAQAVMGQISQARDKVLEARDNFMDEDDWSSADLEIIRAHQALARREQLVDYTCVDVLNDMKTVQSHFELGVKTVIDGYRNQLNSIEDKVLN